MKLFHLNRRGFTLVELMVVMVILGILISIGTFAFQTSQQKSRDSRRKSDLSNIAAALEMYNSDRGRYPAASAGKIAGCGAAYSSQCEWGSVFGNGSTVVYMIKLPKDPSSTRTNYVYEYSSNGYRLYARVENLQDIDIPTTGQHEYDVNCSSTVGVTIYCNYVLTSVNLAAPSVRP